MLAWNDHHLILMIARAGTLGAAARRLGVNETTVARRLAAAETAAGSTLFRRRDRKLVVSAAGRDVVAAAEAMERALAQVSSRSESLHGTVRVSSILCVIEYLLAPRLFQFSARHPNLILELLGTNETSSLARREADIAIRLDRPSRGKLITRRLGRIRFVLAGRRDREPAGYIAYERDLDGVPEARAVMERFAGAPPLARMVTLSGARAAAAAGLGAVMLPDWMVVPGSGVDVIDPDVSVERPLWLAVHEDLKDRPPVRAAADWLAEAIIAAQAENGRARRDP